MIPDDVISYLESVADAHTEWARKHAAKSLEHLADNGIAPESDLAQLYARFGWSFRTREPRYELLAPDEISEWTSYAHDELNVPQKFMALTSNEGQGIILLDRDNDTVFDVEYGQFDLLENESLSPLSESFADFLAWYVGTNN